LQQRSLFRPRFGFLWGMTHGAGHLSLVSRLRSFFALAAAAYGADGLGPDLDDLAELAEDHERGVSSTKLMEETLPNVGGMLMTPGASRRSS
jgi:hypothetical protein